MLVKPHDWEICRKYPPLSRCRQCLNVVAEIKGTEVYPNNIQNEEWTCKKCNKKQNLDGTNPNQNGSYCKSCWKQWKTKPNQYILKSTTDKHPHKQGKNLHCTICKNENLTETIFPIKCPNCGFNSLVLVSNQIGLELGSEIKCTECLTHWTRTKNW